MEGILRFEDVTFSYQNGSKTIDILKDAVIGFDEGVFYSVIGPSGIGKTTVLALAGALDVPKSGKIMFNGRDIRKIGFTAHRRNNISLIFQNYNLLNYMTAYENVVMAMEISGSHKGKRKQKALCLLEDMGLTHDEAVRPVMKLSGGQQQRVAIARAIAGDPKVILADEPTGNLDSETAGEIINIFKDLAHEYMKCVIVVSHSGEVADASDIAYGFEKSKLIRIK